MSSTRDHGGWREGEGRVVCGLVVGLEPLLMLTVNRFTAICMSTAITALQSEQFTNVSPNPYSLLLADWLDFRIYERHILQMHHKRLVAHTFERLARLAVFSLSQVSQYPLPLS